MSTLTIKAVWPGEKIEDLEELGNAWLGAYAMWEAIGKRYLGSKNAILGDDRKKLWDLYRDKTVPLPCRAALMMTFDGAWILKKDYARAASDLTYAFETLWLSGHWLHIRDVFLSDPDCPAIAFHMTSVGEFVLEEWDEEIDGMTYVWSKGYDLYGALDKGDKG